MTIRNSGIVLFQGYPGSGKSTAAERLAAEHFDGDHLDTAHFSIGSHLRKIAKSEVESKFQDELKSESETLANSQRLSDDLVNRIVDEYLGTLNASNLVLVDGYPLYEAQVPVFDQNVRGRGLRILGLLDIQVPPELAVERIMGRGTRDSENTATIEFALQRIAEHQRDCLGATALLSVMHHTVSIDGSLPPEQVISQAKDAINTFGQIS